MRQFDSYTTLAYILTSMVEIMVFCLPATIPQIKHKARMDRKWRWRLILILVSLPLFYHFAYRLWTVPIDEVYKPCAIKGELGLCEERFNINWIEMELNQMPVRGGIADEIRWRYIVFWENQRCFSDDAIVCDAVNHWLTKSQTKTPLFTLEVLIFTLAVSFMTGIGVYWITRDPVRKEKQKHG